MRRKDQTPQSLVFQNHTYCFLPDLSVEDETDLSGGKAGSRKFTHRQQRSFL